MGVRVSKAIVVWGCVVLVGLCAWGAVLQGAYVAPVDSGVQGDPVCEQYLPHYDYITESVFHAWVSERVGEHTNVWFDSGAWYADGMTIGYGATEDGAIYSHRECV